MHEHKFEPYKSMGAEIVYKCSCDETKRELKNKVEKKPTIKEKIAKIFK